MKKSIAITLNCMVLFLLLIGCENLNSDKKLRMEKTKKQVSEFTFTEGTGGDDTLSKRINKALCIDTTYIEKQIGKNLSKEEIGILQPKYSFELLGNIKKKIFHNKSSNIRCKPFYLISPESNILFGECRESDSILNAENIHLLTYNESGEFLDILSFKKSKEGKKGAHYYSYLNYRCRDTILVHLMDTTETDDQPTPLDAIIKDIWSINLNGKFEFVRSENVQKSPR